MYMNKSLKIYFRSHHEFAFDCSSNLIKLVEPSTQYILENTREKLYRFKRSTWRHLARNSAT